MSLFSTFKNLFAGVELKHGSRSETTPAKQASITPHIAVVVSPRRDDGTKLRANFPFDRPDLAFEQMYQKMIAQPFVYSGITGTRIDANGSKITLFRGMIEPNYPRGVYDCAFAFADVWNPPPEFQREFHLPIAPENNPYAR